MTSPAPFSVLGWSAVPVVGSAVSGDLRAENDELRDEEWMR